jgi:hypothetical protein
LFHLRGEESLDVNTLLNKNICWDEAQGVMIVSGDFLPGEVTAALTSEGVVLFDRLESYSPKALSIFVNTLDFEERRINLTMHGGELIEMNSNAHVVFLTGRGARERIPHQLLDPFVWKLSFL